MATRRFALYTQPHVAEIGDNLALEFKPEVMGDDFLDAYEALQTRQRELGIDPDNMAAVEPANLRQANTAVRDFLASLMLPESAERFAEEPLPDRIMAQLFEWVVELYGGGERPTGSSSGSAAASPTAGRSSTGRSPSKASTRTGGR